MKELFFHILRYLRPIIKEISPYTLSLIHI